MFGSANGKESFCSECAMQVRKVDLSEGGGILMRRIMMIVAVLAAMTGANAQQEDKDMETTMGIRFEPQEWMELELDWSEYVWSMERNTCTPFVDVWRKSVLNINVPTKIFVDSKSLHEVVPAIPVSGYTKTSENRSYKYHGTHHLLKLYISKAGEKEVLYESLAVVEREPEWPTGITDKHPEPKPVDPIQEAKENAKRENAMSIPDEELDKGHTQFRSFCFTFNACDYVSMPLQPGKYEVYCTFRGLESEHKVVEIVFE